MFQPSTSRGTAEDWAKYLRRNGKLRKLANTLLSQNRTMDDKTSILFKMPKSAAKNMKDMYWLDKQLQDTGWLKLAQIVRYAMCEALSADLMKKNKQWAQYIITLNIEARWVVQRELYVQEEVQALSKALNLPGDKQVPVSTESSQLCLYEKELEQLNDQYWEYLRLSGKLLGDIPCLALERAFKACRNDPYWYMSEFLVNECANRGGCCRFGCGCCYKNRNTHRAWGKGHCTSACGCCIRTRKSQKKVRKQDDLEDFPFDIVAGETSYSGLIYLAYIWGFGGEKASKLLDRKPIVAGHTVDA